MFVWKPELIEKLKRGNDVRFVTHDDMYHQRIKNGDEVHIEPVTLEQVQKNDIVLLESINPGRYFLARVRGFKEGKIDAVNSRKKPMGLHDNPIGRVVGVTDDGSREEHPAIKKLNYIDENWEKIDAMMRRKMNS